MTLIWLWRHTLALNMNWVAWLWPWPGYHMLCQRRPHGYDHDLDPVMLGGVVICGQQAPEFLPHPVVPWRCSLVRVQDDSLYRTREAHRNPTLMRSYDRVTVAEDWPRPRRILPCTTPRRCQATSIRGRGRARARRRRAAVGTARRPRWWRRTAACAPGWRRSVYRDCRSS